MKGHVNSSGFPLQIAIENHVHDTCSEHGWRTRYTEHSWNNEITGESGFIDLVLANQYGTQFLVVECKRVMDTSWIFLASEKAKNTQLHAKSFVLNKDENNLKRYGWADLILEPSTPESQYCVIPGTDNRSHSLIERASAEPVAATEALAFEDKSLSLNDRRDLKIYINVIVTTAQIQICRFDPSSISLEDGKLEEAEFEEVPFVRFRKQLATAYELSEIYAVAGNKDIARAKENTIFVVNSVHLSDFLREFEVDDCPTNSRYLR